MLLLNRWFIASNTGRGYALTGKEMSDTGILGKAGRARGIAGFDGYKD
jgi:ABC-type hemin transport system substrate-binding protein